MRLGLHGRRQRLARDLRIRVSTLIDLIDAGIVNENATGVGGLASYETRWKVYFVMHGGEAGWLRVVGDVENDLALLPRLRDERRIELALERLRTGRALLRAARPPRDVDLRARILRALNDAEAAIEAASVIPEQPVAMAA